MLDAAMQDGTDFLRLLLDAGADRDQCWIFESAADPPAPQTPMTMAASCGNLAAVELLLSSGPTAAFKQ